GDVRTAGPGVQRYQSVPQVEKTLVRLLADSTAGTGRTIVCNGGVGESHSGLGDEADVVDTSSSLGRVVRYRAVGNPEQGVRASIGIIGDPAARAGSRVVCNSALLDGHVPAAPIGDASALRSR